MDRDRRWPEPATVTAAEVDVFEAWFGDLLATFARAARKRMRDGGGYICVPSFVPKWRARKDSNL